jgi:hypothetical protein
MDATTTGESNEGATGTAAAHEATLTRDAAVTTPTPRATRGGSFAAPILTQLVSLHKHYKHRVQAKWLVGVGGSGI